jgi:hypothetical protein
VSSFLAFFFSYVNPRNRTQGHLACQEPAATQGSVLFSFKTRPSNRFAVASTTYTPPAADAGMPPILATENQPLRGTNTPRTNVCIVVCTDALMTRDCEFGSTTVWYGAKAHVQLVESIIVAPMSDEKSKAKLSNSPTSIGSKGVAIRIAAPFNEA